MRFLAFATLLSMVLAVSAFAADSQPATQPSVNSLDSRSTLPTTESLPFANKSGSNILSCYRMRTYRVRKNLDRNSVIPATPDDASFDPDYIVSYSTCQRADKFDFHTTH